MTDNYRHGSQLTAGYACSEEEVSARPVLVLVVYAYNILQVSALPHCRSLSHSPEVMDITLLLSFC